MATAKKNSAQSSGKTIIVKQIRSGASCTQGVKGTLTALGLGKLGREKTLSDNPAVRGMINKVDHLVQVFEQ